MFQNPPNRRGTIESVFRGKALLFDSSHQAAVDHDSRRGIRVIRVDSQDDHLLLRSALFADLPVSDTQDIATAAAPRWQSAPLA